MLTVFLQLIALYIQLIDFLYTALLLFFYTVVITF